jgi:UDP-N-acetylmuramate dehydrogenase
VAIARRAGEIRARRAATQPTRARSAGCAFKNPAGASAGQSIDRAGLKGLRVGGAEVSTIHANYLVNTGGATADDIRRLMGEVQERVLRTLGLRLEIEVRLLGFSG